MGRLATALDDAFHGRYRFALICGEPGIGKSRLVEEIAVRAARRGARIQIGRCHDGQGTPAYWPWTQVTPGDWAALAAGAADGDPTADPSSVRFAFFERVAGAFRRASQAGPLLVVLEDLQWADAPSVLLLRFLAAQLTRTPLFLVATCRDSELGDTHPLREALADLRRELSTQVVTLAPLPAAEARTLATAAAGEPIPAPVAAAIAARTEGNPFFVEETVRHLQETHALGRATAAALVSIPTSVHDAIERRLARLDAATCKVLEVAAVIGRDVDPDVLARVAGARAERALHAAVAARLVMAPIVGQYRFAHDLVRETLAARIGAVRRRLLHRRIGTVLEELHGARPDLATALAQHFLLGDDLERAAAFAARAGRQATAQLAYEEGVRLYHLALDAHRRRRPPTGAGSSAELDLLLALGTAERKAGFHRASRTTFQEAVAAAEALGDSARHAEAALGFAASTWCAGADHARPGAEVERAIHDLDPSDLGLRVRLLSSLAYSSRGLDRTRLIEPAREAVAIAKALGDRRLQATALRGLHYALWGPEHLVERLEAAERMVRLAETSEGAEARFWTHAQRAIDRVELGQMASVDEDVAVCAQLARDASRPFFQWGVQRLQVMRLVHDGRFAEAEALLDANHALGEVLQTAVADQNHGIQLFEIRRAQGRLAEVEPLVRDMVGRHPDRKHWRACLALLLAEGGRAAEARAAYDELAGEGFDDVPRWQWLGTVGLAAETVARLRAAEPARRLYALLRPYAAHNLAIGLAAVSRGVVAQRLGVLAGLFGDHAQAVAHLEDALAANERLGARAYLAETHVDLAEVLLAQGRDDAAVSLLDRGQSLAHALGMSSLRARIETLRRPAMPQRFGHIAVVFLTVDGLDGDEPAERAVSASIARSLATHAGFEAYRDAETRILAFPTERPARAFVATLEAGVAAYNTADPTRRVRLRCGVHTGKAVDEAVRFFRRTGPAGPTTGRAAPPPALPPVAFSREGGHWVVGYGGVVRRFRDQKGLRHLAHLVSRPGEEFHVLELLALSEDEATPLDARTRVRSDALAAEIEAAERDHDPEHASRARAALASLRDEAVARLVSGTCDGASAPERARLTVTKRIKLALRRIGLEHPALGRHLGQTVRTGYFCTYQMPRHPADAGVARRAPSSP